MKFLNAIPNRNTMNKNGVSIVDLMTFNLIVLIETLRHLNKNRQSTIVKNASSGEMHGYE